VTITLTSKLKTLFIADEIKIVFTGQKLSKKIIHPIINKKKSVSTSTSSKNNFLDPQPEILSKNLCCVYGNSENDKHRDVLENDNSNNLNDNDKNMDNGDFKNDGSHKKESYACLSFPSNKPVTFTFIMVFICVFICMYIFVFCIFLYIHMCICIYVYIYLFIYAYLYLNIYLNICKLNMFIYIYTSIYMCTCIYIHRYKYIHIHKYIYIGYS
jgi:hypothetical protein